MEKIKSVYKFFIARPEYVYNACDKKHIAILKLDSDTQTNENRENVIDKLHAKHFALKAKTIVIFDKHEPYKTVNCIVSDDNIVLTTELNNNDVVADTFDKIHYYKSIECPFYYKLDNIFNGKYYEWHENGRMLREKTYCDGMLNESDITWYENGQKSDEYIYNCGIVISHKKWTEAGEEHDLNILSKTDMKCTKFEHVQQKNKLSDTFVEFYENGQKRAELHKKNGKLHGSQLKWYRNGQKMGQYNYVNGKLDGLYLEWYENGEKKETRTYINCKLHGVYTEWYNNQQKEMECNYVDGKLCGLYLEWDKYGNETKRRNYENNVLLKE